MEDFTKYLSILSGRIIDIVSLIIPAEKIEITTNLFIRYTSELSEAIGEPKSAEEIEGKFKPFINNVLSIIETLGLSESQFKAVRKLILNEIYNCQKMLMGMCLCYFKETEESSKLKEEK